MKNDIGSVNFKICACLSLLFILVTAFQYVYWTSFKYVANGIVFGLYYYIKYCWTYIVWMGIQNFLMRKHENFTLGILMSLGVAFISLFAFLLWEESYTKDEFYQFLGLANFMSVILAFLLHKYVGPLYKKPSKG